MSSTRESSRILDGVPKLWDDTIEAHRRSVRQAILDTTAALVAEHGLRAVTMSQIAEQARIGRATLYKYFPDVDAILLAWHEQQVARHLGQLAALRDQAGEPLQRLGAVLEAYALIQHERVQHEHDHTDLAALVHRGDHVSHARQHLKHFIRDLVRDCVPTGEVRADVSAEELATYCLHAVDAARSLPSKAAVRRLVKVTLTGLRRAP